MEEWPMSYHCSTPNLSAHKVIIPLTAENPWAFAGSVPTMMSPRHSQSALHWPWPLSAPLFTFFYCILGFHVTAVWFWASFILFRMASIQSSRSNLNPCPWLSLLCSSMSMQLLLCFRNYWFLISFDHYSCIAFTTDIYSTDQLWECSVHVCVMLICVTRHRLLGVYALYT